MNADLAAKYVKQGHMALSSILLFYSIIGSSSATAGFRLTCAAVGALGLLGFARRAIQTPRSSVAADFARGLYYSGLLVLVLYGQLT